MKNLMACVMLSAALCCGTTAMAQNVNGTTGASQQSRKSNQNTAQKKDFKPCQCCMKNMPKPDGTHKPDGKNKPPQGQGQPPQNANSKNGHGQKPPQGMQPPQCKCSKDCKNCDCHKTSSKKNNKKKKTKNAA